MIHDTIGHEVYSSHYRERRTLLACVICMGAIAVVTSIAVVVLCGRPTITRYVRIDDVGRATPIAYNDLSYTPREGEIRMLLWQWATFRYERYASTISKTYPKNYFFLNEPLAASAMSDDTKARTVASVAAGTADENDLQVTNITFTSLDHEHVQRAQVATGTALIDLTKLYSSTPPRKERWQVSLKFYLSPSSVSERAKTAPQLELINPLGLVITEFHESRVSE